jgi:hypothetical protein
MATTIAANSADGNTGGIDVAAYLSDFDAI